MRLINAWVCGRWGVIIKDGGNQPIGGDHAQQVVDQASDGDVAAPRLWPKGRDQGVLDLDGKGWVLWGSAPVCIVPPP